MFLKDEPVEFADIKVERGLGYKIIIVIFE